MCIRDSDETARYQGNQAVRAEGLYQARQAEALCTQHELVMAGNHDDRKRRQRRIGHDGGCELDAAEIRELRVDDEEIDPALEQPLAALDRVLGDDDVIARIL